MGGIDFSEGDMAGSLLHDFLNSLRRAADRSAVSDAQLLQRFTEGDESAFELLVGRHAPMVFGVCRRVLGDAHDTEDAVQAAFLLLARKAASAARCRSAGGWLHTVAYRAALRARARRSARSVREQPLDEGPPATCLDPADEAAWREVRQAIDEEVSRLPERYRVPFVLYYLEGRSSAEVARELGCSVGTVDSRLTRARERLRARLGRRGLAPAPGLWAVLAPSRLAPRRAEPAWAALAAGRGIPSRAAVLADEVARGLRASRAKAAVILLAVVAISSAGLAAGLLTQPAPAPNPAQRATNLDSIEPFTLREEPNHGVSAIALSPNGQTLAWGGDFTSVSLWDVETRKRTVSLMRADADEVLKQNARNGLAMLGAHAENVRAVAFSPDGKTLASGGVDQAVRLWDVAKKEEKAILRGHTVFVYSVAFSPDGKTLASAGGAGPAALDRTIWTDFRDIPKELLRSEEIGELKVWDLATGQARTFFRGNTGRITSVAFSPDGRTLAAGGRDGAIRLWDVIAGKERACLQKKARGIRAVAFTMDGKVLASADEDQQGAVNLWDVASGRVQARLEGHAGGVLSVAFSPDGKVLATASNVSPRDPARWRDATGEVRLWDAVSGRPRGAPLTFDHSFVSMAFGARGKLLAVGGLRGRFAEVTMLATGSRP